VGRGGRYANHVAAGRDVDDRAAASGARLRSCGVRSSTSSTVIGAPWRPFAGATAAHAMPQCEVLRAGAIDRMATQVL
jgi:hypothetical protein